MLETSQMTYNLWIPLIFQSEAINLTDNHACVKGLPMDGFVYLFFLLRDPLSSPPPVVHVSFLLVWSVSYLRSVSLSNSNLEEASKQGFHHLLNILILNPTHSPSLLPMCSAQNPSDSLFFLESEAVFCWSGRDFWGSK